MRITKKFQPEFDAKVLALSHDEDSLVAWQVVREMTRGRRMEGLTEGQARASLRRLRERGLVVYDRHDRCWYTTAEFCIDCSSRAHGLHVNHDGSRHVCSSCLAKNYDSEGYPLAA